MPYGTAVAGTTITASFYNTNARDQVISTFTDSTARSTAITAPVEGMVSYLTGSNRLDVYNASTWSTLINPTSGAWITTFTPQLNQVNFLTCTTNRSAYIRIGRMVHFQWSLTVTGGSGVGSNAIQVSVPFTAAAGTEFAPNNHAVVYESGSNTNFACYTAIWAANRDFTQMHYVVSNAGDNRIGIVGLTAALNAGDACGGSITYETAADA